MLIATVGGMDQICFKWLRIHTQGCQGCQKIRNLLRNSKILIARSHSCLYCSGNLAINFGRFWCKNRPFYYCKHGENWSSEDPHCSLLICSLKWAQVKYKRLGYISLSPIVVFRSNLTCHEWKMAKNGFVPRFGHFMWQKLQKSIKLKDINRKYPFQ